MSHFKAKMHQNRIPLGWESLPRSPCRPPSWISGVLLLREGKGRKLEKRRGEEERKERGEREGEGKGRDENKTPTIY